MIRNALLILACSSSVSELAAQPYVTLDVNDVRFDVRANGHIGKDYYFGAPTFEVPANNGTTTLYGAGIWLTGRTGDGQLKTAVDLFGYGEDFFPGPLTVTGDASITEETSDLFDHVWNIRASDVERHRAYFNCLGDPQCDMNLAFPDGYIIPMEFITWPGNGDVDQGQALYLAPFFDHNSDGAYSAFDGDHPCVPGDQTLFSIFNDKLAPHTVSFGDAMGIEVHMTTFGYEGNDPALAQTVFIQYKLINRGSQTLSDLHVGMFMDPDLGCANDDFLGTDVGRSLFYVYNWDDFDDDNCNGAMGYGAQPPAFGVVVLKGLPMDPDGTDNVDLPSVAAFNGSGFNDGIIDNECLGLSGSIKWYRDGPPAMSDPITPVDFDNYLRSTWKDGTHLTYGNWGYSSLPTSTLCDFIFPGDSDPLGLGSNNLPQEPWSESIQAAADRYGVASIGGVTLEPGEENDFLIAYVFARATTGGALASITALQQRVDSIATFAETIPGLVAPGAACDALTSVGVQDHRMENLGLSLFPVPANQVLNVGTGQFNSGDRIEIFDALGEQVLNSRTTGAITSIDVLELAPGLYTVRITGSGSTASGRFVKE